MPKAALVLTAALLLSGVSLRGQAWGTFYAAYLDGLAAQREGQDARALAAFRSAAALNPRPGTRIRTYGLNFLQAYHPYLHLAEAALAVGRLDQAEDALKASLDLGLEPPDRLALLRGRLAQARASLAPPPGSVPDAGAGWERRPWPGHRRRHARWADRD